MSLPQWMSRTFIVPGAMGSRVTGTIRQSMQKLGEEKVLERLRFKKFYVTPRRARINQDHENSKRIYNRANENLYQFYMLQRKTKRFVTYHGARMPPLNQKG